MFTYYLYIMDTYLIYLYWCKLFVFFFGASVLIILYSQPFTTLLYILTKREDYSRPTNTRPIPHLPRQLFDTGRNRLHARNKNFILCGPTTWPRNIPGPHGRPTPLVRWLADCCSSVLVATTLHIEIALFSCGTNVDDPVVRDNRIVASQSHGRM